MTPSVSIIVPCYNVAPYVDACLDSLVRQSLKEIEIICVNDGSTDETPARLREWEARDSRIRIIDQANAGPAAARNAGLDAASGVFLGFTDPDDWVSRDMFARLCSGMEEYGADAAVCGFRTFSGEGGEAAEQGGWSPGSAFYPEETVCRFRRGSAWSRCVGPVWNKLFRRELVERLGLRFRTEIWGEEDMAFQLMLLPFAPRLLTLPDCAYHYRRQREGSFTYGEELFLKNFRMDFLNMQSVTAFWKKHGLWTPETAFGLVDFYMEFLRRHFIMPGAAFSTASAEDRQALLQGWKLWLEQSVSEECLAQLDKWDGAFCRLLRELPPSPGLMTRCHDRLMSLRKGRRGAYYALKGQMR